MILRGLLYNTLCGLLIALFSLTASAQEKLAEQATPEEIEQFVHHALVQGRASFALSEYTHIQKLKITEVDKKGNQKVRLSTVKEAFVPSRFKKGQRWRWVYVLIEKDGKPVPAAEIEKERLKAGERLAKEEEEWQKSAPTNTEQAEQERLPPPRGIYFSLSFNAMFGSDVLFNVRSIMAGCTFSNLRYETINGRPMVSFDFAPKPDAQWDSAESFQAQMTGRAWFDLQEIMLAKLEGWPLGQTRPDQPYVLYESLRTPDGQWLPRVIAVNGNGNGNGNQRKPFFKRELDNIVVEFADYQRFGTEVKDVQMKDPVKPQ